jgi:hypothetical protein
VNPEYANILGCDFRALWRYDMQAGFGEEETTELPGKDEDVSVHMKELQEYEDKLSKPSEKAWDPSKGMETHPLFFSRQM